MTAFLLGAVAGGLVFCFGYLVGREYGFAAGARWAQRGQVLGMKFQEYSGRMPLEPVCDQCHGARRVCEFHDRRAWPTECACGAGMPCPSCNPLANAADQSETFDARQLAANEAHHRGADS